MPGSHGSLTKAGKVRSQTRKIPSMRGPKPISRVRLRHIYRQRVVVGQPAGQYKGETDRRYRKRR